MPEEFLAAHDLAPDATAFEARRQLKRLAEAAHAVGVRAKESWLSVERAQAVTLFDAEGPEQVREAFLRAGLPTPDVFRGERVFTDLLDEPRRAR